MKNLSEPCIYLWKRLLAALNSGIFFLIYCYRVFLRPFMGNTCRFPESCSQYCVRVCKDHGPFKGIFLGFRRILICNPLTPLHKIYEKELPQ